MSYLVWCGGACQVEDLNVSLCRPNYHQWIGYVESVATFRESDGGYKIVGPDIPVLSNRLSVGQHRGR